MNDLKALVKRLTDGGVWHVCPCADSQGDCTCGLPKLIRAVEDHDCMATVEAFCGKPTETDRADNAEAERDRLRQALVLIEVQVSSDESRASNVLATIGRMTRAALAGEPV